MKKIISFLSHGLFYTLAVGIESVAPFVLAPILTHYLSVYEYGIWAIFQTAVAFLRPLLGLTLDDYVRMQYYKESPQKMVGYILSIIILSGILTAALSLIAFLCRSWISHILHFPQEWLWSIMACAWLYAMFYLFLAYYQLGTKRVRFAIIQMVQAAITILTSILLVMTGWGWTGAAIGKIIGLVCGAGLAWLWIALHFPKAAERYIQLSHVLDLVRFGLRYLPTGMLVVVVILTDRLMLANMLNLEATSLFSVASLFPMVLFIGVQGLMFGWQPWCFSRLSRHRREDAHELAIGATIYLIALPLGAIVLTYLSRWLGPYVIDKQFILAFDYVSPLMMAMVAQGFYLFAQSILHYYRRLELSSFMALMIMGINIALNFILITKMGTIGSAWATCIAYAAGFIVTAVLAWDTLSKRYLATFITESANV